MEPSGAGKDITVSVGVEGGSGKSMECLPGVLRLAVQGVLDAPSLASRGRWGTEISTVGFAGVRADLGEGAFRRVKLQVPPALPVSPITNRGPPWKASSSGVRAISAGRKGMRGTLKLECKRQAGFFRPHA